jgi:hypothetical protein
MTAKSKKSKSKALPKTIPQSAEAFKLLKESGWITKRRLPQNITYTQLKNFRDVKALKSLLRYAQSGPDSAAIQRKIDKMKQGGQVNTNASTAQMIQFALKHVLIGDPKYDNRNLKKYPRRLIHDTTPRGMGYTGSKLAELKKMTFKDRRFLYRRAMQVCNNGVGREYVKDLIQNETKHVFFSRNSGTIVSFCIVDFSWGDRKLGGLVRFQNKAGQWVVREEKHWSVAEIDLVCAERGGGLSLIKNFIEFARRHKYDLIRLEAVSRAAAKAYTKIGFQFLNDYDSAVVEHPDGYPMYFFLKTPDRKFLKRLQKHELSDYHDWSIYHPCDDMREPMKSYCEKRKPSRDCVVIVPNDDDHKPKCKSTVGYVRKKEPEDPEE